MKYKVGDKFLQEIEVGQIVKGDVCPYKMLPDGGGWSETALDELRRPDDMIADETWRIAEKLIKMSIKDRVRIFGNSEAYGVINAYSFPEIKTKIKAWEAEKEIKVGDVVRHIDNPKIKVVITQCYHDDDEKQYDGVNAAGGVYSGITKKDWKKTGQHIDVHGLLEQIRGLE